MADLDFDEIKRLAFDKFQYDIGPLKEIQLLFFLVSIALQKSEAQFSKIIDEKISETGNSINDKSLLIDEQLDALVEIYKDIKLLADSIKENSDSARESVIQAIKAGSAAVATQSEASVLKLTEHMELSTTRLLEEIRVGVSKAVTENVNKFVSEAIDRKLSEAGNPLDKAIAGLKTSTIETDRHASNIIDRLKEANKKTALSALGGAIGGTLLTFFGLLLLQNVGIINVPFNISLDAHAVSQYILHAMRPN